MKERNVAEESKYVKRSVRQKSNNNRDEMDI